MNKITFNNTDYKILSSNIDAKDPSSSKVVLAGLRSIFENSLPQTGSSRFFQVTISGTPHLLVLTLSSKVERVIEEALLINFSNGSSVYPDFPTERKKFEQRLQRFPVLNVESLPDASLVSAWAAPLLEKPLGVGRDSLKAAFSYEHSSLAEIQELPHSLLSKLFNNPPQWVTGKNSLSKVFGWILCVQKTLELDSQTALELISKYQLGKMMSQCLDALSKIPEKHWVPLLQKKFQHLSINLMKLLMRSYFSVGSEANKVVLGGKAPAQVVDFSELENYLSATKELRRTAVFAVDEGIQKPRPLIRVALSGRAWMVNSQSYQTWLGLEYGLCDALPSYTWEFGPVRLSNFEFSLLKEALSIYLEDLRANEINSYHIFEDPKKVKDHFAFRLYDIYKSNSPYSEKEVLQLFSAMRSLYPQAFEEKDWNRLKLLFMTPSRTEKHFLELIHGLQLSKEQLLCLFLFGYTCGELKIAVDCFRELPQLTKDQIADLPPTLGERLSIIAFRPNEKKGGAIEEIDVCDRCLDIWPVYETIYWAIRTSGLSLNALKE